MSSHEEAPESTEISFDGLFHKLYAWVSSHQNGDGSYDPWVMKLPMQLTFSRIGIWPLALIFGVLIREHHRPCAILTLIGIALLFLTDAFDGGIARATNNVTVAGARWDPTIDKISEVFLFASFCWALAAVFPHFFWAFFWIVMLRVPFEIGISILAILGEKITIGGKAGAAGKRKFTFDCLSFLFAGAGLISGMSFLLGISCGFIGATYPYAARVLVEEWRNVIPAYRKYLKERKPRT